MRELTVKETKEIQKCEVEILKELDRITRKHNLKYMLVGGTLLGAIRHKGFIPWDDDIDIAMPRKDYEKFKEIVSKETDEKKYYFQDMYNSDKYGMIFGKLKMKNTLLVEGTNNLPKEEQNIWIDIFPYDKTSKNMFIAKVNLIRGYIYKIIYYLKCGNKLVEHTFIRKVAAFVLKVLSLFYTKKSCKRKIEKLYKKYELKKECNYVSYGGTYIFKEITTKEYFDNLIETDFENNSFYIPKEYDEYLTRIYGDYMKLPPKEKQKSHHEIIEVVFPKK